MAKATRKNKRVKRKKATPQELEQRNHRSEIRSVFSKIGFTKVVSVSDKEVEFKGKRGDFDDIFVFQNIVVLTEYTCSKSDKISTHLLKKKILFDHVLDNRPEFIEFLEEKFETFKDTRDDIFTADECEVIIIYCSKNSISKTHKDQVPRVKYLDYPVLKYFKGVSDAIKLSARPEFLHFLGLNYDQVGHGNDITKKDVDGSLLPESYSNFKKGYKIVTFYVDAKSLLHRSYVLRKDGRRNDSGLYQRMISKAKVNSVRKYLRREKRVFINNIVVTLPNETKLLDENGNTVDSQEITKTTQVAIQIPNGFNTIGLIDGQHRVFAYHEGGDFDDEIEKLRIKQNLLVTGVIYPDDVKSVDKAKFEAQLFLEINSNQTNAKSDLKQYIGLVLKPFSAESIAKAVVHQLDIDGPLENQFEKHFYEKDKLKTTSIVSYGLKPLVKLSGTDSLYHLWTNEKKGDLLKGEDENLLYEYIAFCVVEINQFLAAVRQVVDDSKWTTDKILKNKLLSTNALNGLIICLRRLIEEGQTDNQAGYVEKLGGLDNFDFAAYKSSQYGAMSRDIYDQFFSKVIYRPFLPLSSHF